MVILVATVSLDILCSDKLLTLDSQRCAIMRADFITGITKEHKLHIIP